MDSFLFPVLFWNHMMFFCGLRYSSVGRINHKCCMLFNMAVKCSTIIGSSQASSPYHYKAAHVVASLNLMILLSFCSVSNTYFFPRELYLCSCVKKVLPMRCYMLFSNLFLVPTESH